jgi:Aspartyl protease
VLKRYEVVFDYPARSFTLAQSGSIRHRGTPVDVGVQPKTGFARVKVTIGRQTYGFMLDTGAAYTGVSRALMDRMIAEHPSWPHSVGAVGAANMVGKEFDASNEMLRVPEIRWGPFLLRNVGMVSRPEGVYEKVVSADMTEPIVGVLAGNVLRQFRIDLDYPAGIAYLESGRRAGGFDLDCVGLVVQVKEDGTALVSGVARKNGRPEITGVQAGDRLLRVDQHGVTGAPLAAIHEYLSGTVGERKRLTVRRGEQTFSISAFVSRHP